MRYTPLETEVTLLDDMTSAERMHYATTRMVESEEVWSMGNEDGWAIHDVDDLQVIRIWPYRQFAEEHGVKDNDSMEAQATSLENFVYNVLDMCKDGDIWLEVFPVQGLKGYLMEAADLFEIFKSMLDTGEYFIEG